MFVSVYILMLEQCCVSKVSVARACTVSIGNFDRFKVCCSCSQRHCERFTTAGVDAVAAWLFDCASIRTNTQEHSGFPLPHAGETSKRPTGEKNGRTQTAYGSGILCTRYRQMIRDDTGTSHDSMTQRSVTISAQHMIDTENFGVPTEATWTHAAR